MSELAYQPPPVQTGVQQTGGQPVTDWARRISDAKNARKPYEPIWLSNYAMSAGRHWLKWNRTQRKFVLPEEDRNKETFDLLTERRMTLAGELGPDDDRPELLFRTDDLDGEEYAETINNALEWGWENEFQAEALMEDVRFGLIDVGTMGIWCRWDPSAGQVLPDLVPHLDGKPVDTEAAARVAIDQRQPGRVKLRQLRQGKIRWELLTPFNMLVPPGIPRERDFPWEVVIRPQPVPLLKSLFPGFADQIHPETISSIAVPEGAGSMGVQDPMFPLVSTSKLNDHAFVYTCYERPSPKKPRGERTVLVGQAQVKVQTGPLEYQSPDGDYRTGITYFHLWRRSDVFWSKSMVENTKGIQRTYNKRSNQIGDTIDRGQPYVLMEKGDLVKPSGFPMSVLQVPKGTAPPQLAQGMGPGPWMEQSREQLRADMETASLVKDVSVGDNPRSVGTYSQLALLREQANQKLIPVLKGIRGGVKGLVEDTVFLMRTYWGPQKQMLLAGEDDRLDTIVFNASKIPTFFKVKVAEGSVKPRTQADQLALIQGIYDASVAARTPLPVDWYAHSMQAGEPLPLPSEINDWNVERAIFENRLLEQGMPVEVAYFDPVAVHVPIHRQDQAQALAEAQTGDQTAAQRVMAYENHIQSHLAQEAQKAAQLQQLSAPPQLGPGPPVPAGPPVAPGPPGPVQ